MSKDCAGCAHYLARDRRHPELDRTYATDCCVHPAVRNGFGVLAAKLARERGGGCGPDAMMWTPK